MKKQFASILIILALLIGIFAVPVAAAGTMNLTVSSPSGQPGGEVTVNISVANNPGLASLKFDVAYDSALTLKNVTFNSAFGAYATTPTPYKNPQTLTMISPLAAVSANGVFATLTFTVSADAQIGHRAPVTISYEADDIFDSDYEPVQVSVTNGAVTVACAHGSTKNVPEEPATCGKSGYSAGVYCNDCKTYISGHTVIGATGNHTWGAWTKVDEANHKHSCTVCQTASETKAHTWDGGKQTKAPTCAAVGVITYTCTASGCGDTKTEDIPKLTTHTWGAWGKESDTKHKHTCTVSGCGVSESADHTWDNGKPTKDPTCKEPGVKTYTCGTTGCGATRTEEIPKLTTHTWGKWENADGTNHKHICTVCEKASETAAHKWNDGVVTKTPTCKEEGSKLFTCSDCGGTKTEAIEKLTTHTWGKWENADADSHKRTCTVCGTATDTAKHGFATKYSTDKNQHWYACADCGAKKDAANHTPGAAATETAAQRCTVCNYIITPAKGHTHKWDAKYTTDAESHWYACSGCNEKKDAKAHDFANGCDGLCETCQFTRETSHQFGTEWASDASGHFHACAVCGEKTDLAEHAPGAEATETNAQTCIACNFELAPALGHAHAFGEGWEKDDVNHWHVCACGEKGDEAAHDWNDQGLCSICLAQKPAEEVPANENFPWWIILVAILGIGAVAVIVIVAKKKKK